MKRLLAGALVAGLLVGAVGLTAGAAKRKPKPVKTKLFWHGEETLGEIEMAQSQAGIVTGSAEYMTMDAKAPSGTDSKSLQIVNYGAGPNTNCAGNTLFPVWVGRTTGTVKGTMKATFTTLSGPGEVDVRVFTDVLGLACNETYPVPAREVRVPVAQDGTVEAVLKGPAFKVKQILMLQISPATIDVAGTQRPLPPVVGRVFYDSTEDASVLSFKCIPKSLKAKSCTPK